MTKFLARLVAAIVLLFCFAVAFGGARALASPRPPLRGELVDIGAGRHLRIVCEGPKVPGKPLVMLESGIFGFAADWGEVQKGLAEQGLRSCAYDRAGLGFSDPGPMPRDGVAVVSDLEALLRARGETGPLVLVGHSMAGLHTRLFVLRNPGRVEGLVLVDAVSPELAGTERGREFMTKFNRFADMAEALSQIGVLRATAPWTADQIGLDGPAHDEKVYFFGSHRHNHAAAAETRAALLAADEARQAGALDPSLPVAVVTEGPKAVNKSDWGKGRLDAAHKARHGFVENVPGATHASLLGRDHEQTIVHAVMEVIAADGPPPAETTAALP